MNSDDAKMAKLQRKCARQAERIRTQRVTRLQRERRRLEATYAKKLAQIDATLASLEQDGRPKGRRKRGRKKSDLEERIKAATKVPLTQKEIEKRTSIPYGSVEQFLRRNKHLFKITGDRKKRRFR